MKVQFTEGRTPRHGSQSGALEQLSRLDAKYILLSAPVGSGKSEIGVAAARGAESAFIVSPQNILLEQYARDFPWMPMVKGRKHYTCTWAKMNCADASEMYGNQHSQHCHDYIPARDAFWAGEISVTNLHYAMFAHCPEGYDRRRNLLVVDECHGLEPMLLSLFHLRVYRKDADAMGIRFDNPDVQELFDAFVDQDKALSDEQLRALVPDISQRERIRGTARRLAHVDLRDSKNPWNLRRDRDCLECRPLFARNLAPRLLSMAGQVLFMSGTPGSPDSFFRNLGIVPGKNTAVVSVDSDFPVGEGVRLIKNAPYVNARNLDTAMPILADVSSQILRQLPTEKGLILCASYSVAAKLSDALRPEFGSRTTDPYVPDARCCDTAAPAATRADRSHCRQYARRPGPSQRFRQVLDYSEGALHGA